MNSGKSPEPSVTGKIVVIGKQILASMAIGITIFMIIYTIAQFGFGQDTVDGLSFPILTNFIALVAFPFVRKYMD